MSTSNCFNQSYVDVSILATATALSYTFSNPNLKFKLNTKKLKNIIRRTKSEYSVKETKVDDIEDEKLNYNPISSSLLKERWYQHSARVNGSELQLNDSIAESYYKLTMNERNPKKEYDFSRLSQFLKDRMSWFKPDENLVDENCFTKFTSPFQPIKYFVSPTDTVESLPIYDTNFYVVGDIPLVIVEPSPLYSSLESKEVVTEKLIGTFNKEKESDTIEILQLSPLSNCDCGCNEILMSPTSSEWESEGSEDSLEQLNRVTLMQLKPTLTKLEHTLDLKGIMLDTYNQLAENFVDLDSWNKSKRQARYMNYF